MSTTVTPSMWALSSTSPSPFLPPGWWAPSSSPRDAGTCREMTIRGGHRLGWWPDTKPPDGGPVIQRELSQCYNVAKWQRSKCKMKKLGGKKCGAATKEKKKSNRKDQVSTTTRWSAIKFRLWTNSWFKIKPLWTLRCKLPSQSVVCVAALTWREITLLVRLHGRLWRRVITHFQLHRRLQIRFPAEV